MRMDNIVGIILNGGKSSRMGSDKSALIYQGNSLLEHAKSLFSEVGINNIYVSGNGGIEDIIPDRGPLGGVYSIMQQLANNQEVVIIPVDMPLLSADILSSLILTKHQGDAVHFKGFIMPLKLRLSNIIRKYIEEAVTDNNFNPSVKSLLKKINVDVIDIPTGRDNCFVNTNTPDEWDKIK